MGFLATFLAESGSIDRDPPLERAGLAVRYKLRREPMLRTTFLTGALIFMVSLGATVMAAGIAGTKGNQQQNGPCGYPALKKLTDALSLTHDQEQAVLRIYNEFKKKEHEAQQEAAKNVPPGGKPSVDTKSLRGDMTAEIKMVLTPEQGKKLDD